MTVPGLITVEFVSPYAPPLCEPIEPPLRDFHDIWESEARWMTGPCVLASIVEFLRGRSLTVQLEGTGCSVSVPLPNVRNELGGEAVSIFWLVPEELRGVFSKCVVEIIRCTRDGEALHDFLFCGQMWRPANPETLNMIREMMYSREMDRKARGWPELWVIAARVFGLNPYALPKPAFTHFAG